MIFHACLPDSVGCTVYGRGPGFPSPPDSRGGFGGLYLNDTVREQNLLHSHPGGPYFLGELVSGLPAGPLLQAVGPVPPSGRMWLADVALVFNNIYSVSVGRTMQIKCNK